MAGGGWAGSHVRGIDAAHEPVKLPRLVGLAEPHQQGAAVIERGCVAGEYCERAGVAALRSVQIAKDLLVQKPQVCKRVAGCSVLALEKEGRFVRVAGRGVLTALMLQSGKVVGSFAEIGSIGLRSKGSEVKGACVL